MTYAKSNILQYNVYPPKPKRRREYYPFGLQTANSWTRENVTGNNFLYNGGTELNTTTNVYDLYDPSGADPPQTINHSAFYNQYYIGYTYDDRVDYTGMGDPVCGHCWRTGNSLTLYQRFTGYSTLSMGVDWRPGRSGIAPGSGNHWADGISLSDWSSYGGSQMFRDGLAAGLTAMGNQLYGYANGRLTRVEESNGRIGYWEKYTWLDFTDEDASIGGEQLATRGIGMRFKALGVPSGPNRFVIGRPASERVYQQTQNGSLIPSGPFTGSNADGTTYFEGVRVHTTEVGAIGQGAAGTLPGVGIFVNPRDKYNINLLRHEFGHILQARKWGNDFFYGTIVPTSLVSADAANNGTWDHGSTWTEWTANLLSWRYFGRPGDWDMNNYPIYPVQHSNILAYPPKSINLKN